MKKTTTLLIIYLIYSSINVFSNSIWWILNYLNLDNIANIPFITTDIERYWMFLISTIAFVGYMSFYFGKEVFSEFRRCSKGRIRLFIVLIIFLTILYSIFHLVYNQEQAIITDSVLRSTYGNFGKVVEGLLTIGVSFSIAFINIKVVFEHYNKKSIVLAFGMTILFAVVMRSIFPVNQIMTTILLIFTQLLIYKVSKNYILPAILPNVFIITHYISVTVLVSLFL